MVLCTRAYPKLKPLCYASKPSKTLEKTWDPETSPAPAAERLSTVNIMPVAACDMQHQLIDMTLGLELTKAYKYGPCEQQAVD